jgi:hypothetical protein
MFNMVDIVTQLQPLLLFFFFGCGLIAASKLISRMAKPHGGIADAQQRKEINRGVSLLISLLVYCLFCNLLLLAPSLLEFAGLPSEYALNLHHLSLFILQALVIIIASIGFLSIIRRSIPLDQYLSRLGANGTWLARILPIENRAASSFGLCCSIYIFASLSNIVNGDTGLYHLPFVKHLIAFGPEIGLANIHSRFGFYGIQSFGQAPLESLTLGVRSLSPSLNILFLACFLLYLLDTLPSRQHSATDQKPIENRFLKNGEVPLRSLTSLLLGLAFGITSLSSLVSFDADFALSLCTLILFHAYYFGTLSSHSQLLLWLTACLPLIKLSGLLSVALLSFYAIASFVFYLLDLTPDSSFTSWHKYKPSERWNKYMASIIALAYGTMLLTNLTLSGYLLFPEYRTGPFGKHAVPREEVRELKDRWITGFARSNDTGRVPSASTERYGKAFEWLPEFLSSRRGHLMGFWLVASVAMSMITLTFRSINIRINRDHLTRLSSLCIATSLVSAMALLVMPPNPRFFPWIGPIVYFTVTDLLIQLPILGFLALAAISTVISTRLHRSIIRLAPPPQYRTEIHPKKSFHGWRMRSVDSSSNVQIRTPIDTKECWAIEPPCLPFKHSSGP